MGGNNKTYGRHIYEEVLEERPHVIAGVDLLHLHLGVHVTMIEEVNIGVLDLGEAVGVRGDAYDIVQWEQGVALDLGVDVLALGAAGQEAHQVDVVHQRAAHVHAVPLRAHQLHQVRERRLVVVE